MSIERFGDSKPKKDKHIDLNKSKKLTGRLYPQPLRVKLNGIERAAQLVIRGTK